MFASFTPGSAGRIGAAIFLAILAVSCNQQLPGSQPLQEIAAQESTLAAQNEEPDSDAVDLSRVIALDPSQPYTLPPASAKKQSYLVIFNVNGSAKEAMSAYASPGKRMSRTVKVEIPWNVAAVGAAGDSVLLSARSVQGAGWGSVTATISTAPIFAQAAAQFDAARRKFIASRDSLELAGSSERSAVRRAEIERAYKLAEYKFENNLQPLGSSTGYGNQLALIVEILK